MYNNLMKIVFQSSKFMQTIKQDRPRKYVSPPSIISSVPNFLSFPYYFFTIFFNVCLFTFNYLTIRNESTLRLELLAIGCGMKRNSIFCNENLNEMGGGDGGGGKMCRRQKAT